METLCSLYGQATSREKYEVIVVDDGDDPEVKHTATSFPVRYFHLKRGSSLWKNPARTFNVGLRKAQAPITIIQHSGVMSTGPTIRQFIDAVTDDRCVFGRVQDGINGPDLVSSKHRRPFFFMGALRTEHFIGLGGFDEDYTEYGYEDDDFGWRMNKAGFKIIFDDDIQAIHLPHSRGDYTNGMIRMLPVFNAKCTEGTVVRNVGRDWGAL